MNLQEMIQKYNDDTIALDSHDIKLSDVLIHNKFSKLLEYLNYNRIVYCNDLKKLSQQEYDKLKVDLPNQPGIGDYKVDLYFKKLDEIRKNSNDVYYKKENTNDNERLISSKLIGKIRTNLYNTIDINILEYDDGSEYLDIRKVKSDGTRKNGISIKKKNINEFIEILNEYFKYSSENHMYVEEESSQYNSSKLNSSNDNNLLEDMFEESAESSISGIKKEIIDNEKMLLNELDEKFALSIKLFMKKIESLPLDGDIYRFLKNDYILDAKKELYDAVHQKGLNTAIDIIDKYESDSLPYTQIYDLKIGDLVNTMTICAIADNFNMTLGMYYNEDENYVVLKSQTSGGSYNNKWIDDNKMLYFLQNEDEEKYQSLEFSHKPNQICRDIILNTNLYTKVYLFERNSKNENYRFCGEVKPIKFLNNNKCIVISKI